MHDLALTAKARDPASLAAVLFVAACWGALAVVSGAGLWVLGDLLLRGMASLTPAFLLGSPADGGRAGGIWPMIVSTAMAMAVCVAIVAPVGLLASIWLSEFSTRGGRTGAAVRVSLDVLAGVPSIVFGLFGYAFFCVALGLGPSVLAGGLTLACMVLPLMIRLSEQSLRAVPVSVRQAAEGLALSRWATLRRAVLPAAMPGVISGTMLSLARALSETAALLFTAGYVMRTPGSLDDPGRVLSVHIYDLAMNVPGGDTNAYASALVLVVALLLVAAGGAALAARRAEFRRGL
ncbi:MAG: phosphate ABC transporter permease PstA [Phycisphaerales bacterium]|nr:MAG: phosphate ABC transporter permease PstA [Phycisphaerales bacterium]